MGKDVTHFSQWVKMLPNNFSKMLFFIISITFTYFIHLSRLEADVKPDNKNRRLPVWGQWELCDEILKLRSWEEWRIRSQQAAESHSQGKKYGQQVDQDKNMNPSNSVAVLKRQNLSVDCKMFLRVRKACLCKKPGIKSKEKFNGQKGGT